MKLLKLGILLNRKIVVVAQATDIEAKALRTGLSYAPTSTKSVLRMKIPTSLNVVNVGRQSIPLDVVHF